MNHSYKAFSSGLGRGFFTGFLLHNKSCVYFAGGLVLGCIQYQPLSITMLLLRVADRILVE